MFIIVNTVAEKKVVMAALKQYNRRGVVIRVTPEGWFCFKRTRPFKTLNAVACALVDELVEHIQHQQKKRYEYTPEVRAQYISVFERLITHRLANPVPLPATMFLIIEGEDEVHNNI